MTDTFTPSCCNLVQPLTEILLTECCPGVDRGKEEGGGDPGDPGGDRHDHQEEDGVGLLVVVLDVFILEREDADEDDEEEDVTEGEDVVTGLVAAGRPQPEPLQRDDQLDEDGEEEEEGLVHGGEVDPGVEGDEEDQLDQERGVDEDV